MINHEALRIFMRKYREAELPQLADAMERNLMELLHAQAEFERKHHEFVAHLLFQRRGDK